MTEFLQTFLNGRIKLLLIDGKHTPAMSGREFSTYNPANGKVLAQVAQAGPEDIDAAVAAARKAFDSSWRSFKPFDRQAVLLRLADLVERHFDDLALLDTMDMGAPVASMSSKRKRAVALLRYYAGLATSMHGQTIPNSSPGNVFSYTVREPVGVVAAINPWNSPLVLAIWKIAPALAAGCTVVLKPAEQAPLSPLLLGELCLEAGVPPGVVNVVPGMGDAGAALATHPGIDKVAFTGSTEVGQKIIQASAGNIKRVSLELGGKSPNVVFDDADLDLAVPGSAMAVFANSGQICSAGTRLFVQKGIASEFRARLMEFARTIKVGDPMDQATQMGPVVSKEQFDRVNGYIDVGRREGAAASMQELASTLREGYFISPTVFTGVSDDMRIAREEIFGPVISVLEFDNAPEVVRRANDTPFGLGCGVWTRNIDNAMSISQNVKAGSVWINCYQMMDPAVPFGGYKMSGYGRESGIEHMDEFLNTKAVWLRSAG